MGRRVLKFDGPCGPKGCGITLRAMKFLYAACGGGRSWPIEYHFYDSLPAPPQFVTLYPQKSVSRNFQSFTAPYKFCLLAPSKRGARRCGKGSLRSPPLLVPAAPPCPVGSMSLDSRVAGLPYESSSFATPAVRSGEQKESALMGRLGALLRPTCTFYAECAQGTIKLLKVKLSLCSSILCTGFLRREAAFIPAPSGPAFTF